MTESGTAHQTGAPSLFMNWTIEDWRWTQSPEGVNAVACARLDPTPAQIAKLRKKYSQTQIRVAIELARARSKAARKFTPQIAQHIVGDSAGVEMASSSAAARYKASRFVHTLGEQTTIVDLCCGIGGDSIELAQHNLDVVGVDLDPIRAWMCEHNARIRTIACDALDPSIPHGVFHLDPARRDDEGARSRDLDTLRPGPSVWNELINTRQHGAIKLHPGVHADELPHGELEIVSESGKLTQAVLWIGQLAQSARCATLLDQDGSVVAQLRGDPHRPQDSNAIDAFLHTMDPCVERADLVGELINETGLSLVHPGTGLLTGNAAIVHPMINAFRVIEMMPWNLVSVRHRLHDLDAGVVEIKSRAGVIDTDQVQRELRGSGSESFTVFVLPIADRVCAIIAVRLGKKEPRPECVPGEGEKETG